MASLNGHPAAVKPRCPRCGAGLERFEAPGETELYCPHCLSFTTVDLARQESNERPSPLTPKE